MLTIHSFLQNLFKFLKTLASGPMSISKRDYRTAAVITTGTIVIAVAFNTSGFSGGGKNALASFAESEIEIEMLDVFADELSVEEIEDDTEADIHAELDEEQWQEARLFIGEGLVSSVQENMQEETAGIAENDADVVMARVGKIEPIISYTEADYEVMLRIVEAEAGNCGLIGKILVANVIINRVLDDRFPDTITDVVYQRNKHVTQFSPVSNGSINRVTVTEETIESVNRALLGEDHSEGALFFMMRSASAAKNVSWFDRDLKWLFKEGPHEFFTYP